MQPGLLETSDPTLGGSFQHLPELSTPGEQWALVTGMPAGGNDTLYARAGLWEAGSCDGVYW